MRAALVLLGCLIALPTFGEETTVYKRVRPDGTVEFSDVPVPGGEAMGVPPLPSYAAQPPPPTANRPKSPTTDSQFHYDGVEVSRPAADETLFYDEQGIPVAVGVKPGLNAGDTVAVYLDGRRVAAGTSGSFTIKDVDRGTHSLSAAVEGPGGNILIRSTPVTFHLIHHAKRPTP